MERRRPVRRRHRLPGRKLCASRAFWLAAYPSQGHEIFVAHTRSFAALGGVARFSIYDDVRTAVDKIHNGKGRTVNARLAVMRAHSTPTKKKPSTFVEGF